jgi:hypothetical protein
MHFAHHATNEPFDVAVKVGSAWRPELVMNTVTDRRRQQIEGVDILFGDRFQINGRQALTGLAAWLSRNQGDGARIGAVSADQAVKLAPAQADVVSGFLEGFRRRRRRRCLRRPDRAFTSDSDSSLLVRNLQVVRKIFDFLLGHDG